MVSIVERPRWVRERLVDQQATSDEVVEHGLQSAPALFMRAKPRRRRGCCSAFVGRLAGGGCGPFIRACCSLRLRLVFQYAIFLKFGWRRFSAGTPDALNERQALLAQDALNPANGVAIAIKQ